MKKKPDLKKLKSAAALGDAEAQFNLGQAYKKGKNFAEALKWLRKAAEQGNPEAQ